MGNRQTPASPGSQGLPRKAGGFRLQRADQRPAWWDLEPAASVHMRGPVRQPCGCLGLARVWTSTHGKVEAADISKSASDAGTAAQASGNV